jgi:hypothetical protein
MPKKITVPIPLEWWFKDVQKVEELRTVLETEAFQTAVAILKDIAGPSYGSIRDDHDANSNRYAWLAGYCDAFTDLRKLTKIKGETPNLQPEEWTHIQTPQ